MWSWENKLTYTAKKTQPKPSTIFIIINAILSTKIIASWQMKTLLWKTQGMRTKPNSYYMLFTYTHMLTQRYHDMHFLAFPIQEKCTPLQFTLE